MHQNFNNFNYQNLFIANVILNVLIWNRMLGCVNLELILTGIECLDVLILS
jgi:hypothetical protein